MHFKPMPGETHRALAFLKPGYLMCCAQAQGGIVRADRPDKA
jgi:hypothetical protein